MNRLWQTIKSSKFVNLIRYVREELQNQRLNREVIGEDRDGNKYYQYYSYYGLPTRRQIQFKIRGDWEMRDLVYYRWLRKAEFDPPTEAEKELFYLQERQRFERAALWDQKETLLMEEFRKKRQELSLRNQAMKELVEESSKDPNLDITSKRN